MQTSATRKRLSWHGLTERSAWNSGDIIDVWCADDLFRGIYCGLSYGHDGRIRAEVESIESVEEWRFYDVADQVAIRLVEPSRQLPGPVILPHEYESLNEMEKRFNAADSQQAPPWPHRDLRILLCLLAASTIGWISLFLYVFPFGR